MHPIDSPNAVNGRFVPGNPVTSLAPTYFTASWANAVQDEPLQLLEGGGITPDKGTNNQLRQMFFNFHVTQATALLLMMTNQLRYCSCQK